LEDFAVGVDAFGDADDALVEHFGQFNVAGEDVGAVLVADAEGILKAVGDDEEGAIALAFQQGIGGEVVPIFRAAIASAGMASSVARPIRSRMPCRGASG